MFEKETHLSLLEKEIYRVFLPGSSHLSFKFQVPYS